MAKLPNKEKENGNRATLLLLNCPGLTVYDGDLALSLGPSGYSNAI